MLAINASGISSTSEDFDHALFGRSALALDEQRMVAGTKFVADGEFAKLRTGAPTYAAVLAFDNVELWGIPDPILYRHPRFVGRLPQILGDLVLAQDRASGMVCNVPDGGYETTSICA